MTTATATSSPSLSDELLTTCLDQVQTNVMFADTDLRLVYANNSALETLRRLEPHIYEAFGVKVEDILGGSIHRFHSDADRINSILEDREGVSARGDVLVRRGHAPHVRECGAGRRWCPRLRGQLVGHHRRGHEPAADRRRARTRAAAGPRPSNQGRPDSCRGHRRGERRPDAVHSGLRLGCDRPTR